MHTCKLENESDVKEKRKSSCQNVNGNGGKSKGNNNGSDNGSYYCN